MSSNTESEYTIYCDESEKNGAFFSNFYGGVIVGASQINRINDLLGQAKENADIHSEIKWEKVGPSEFERYKAFIKTYFDEIAKGTLKMRVMFTQNIHVAINLTSEQRRNEYFNLYYQFLKHGFGLAYMPIHTEGAKVRFYLDRLPNQSKERIRQFKGYIAALGSNYHLRNSNIRIDEQDITEIDSKRHMLLQCVDLVLGSIQFRLNEKHKAIPPGLHRRGKRTVAKEKMYKFIRSEIGRVTGKTSFNIGISTGLSAYPGGRWLDPPSPLEICALRTLSRQISRQEKTEKPHSAYISH